MKFNTLKLLVTVGLLTMAILYEQAATQRLNTLLLLGFAILTLPLLRTFMPKRAEWTLFIDPFLITMLNYNSRFSINFLVMLLYLLVIYELVMVQHFPYNVLQSVVLAVNVVYSFHLVLQYGFNFQMLTQLFFLSLVFVLFGTLLIFIKSTREVRDEAQSTNEKLIQANAALEKANREVERLVRVEERSHVSRELHDTVGHEVTGLIMEIEMLRLACPDVSLGEKISESADHARLILKTLRELVDVYKTIDSGAVLLEMLEKRIATFEAQTGVNVTFDCELENVHCSSEVNEVIYRTVLEALTNVAKHSGASRAWVSIQLLDGLEVLVKIIDNGKGTSSMKWGNGLKFIEERLNKLEGTLKIDSGENKFGIVAQVKCQAGGAR